MSWVFGFIRSATGTVWATSSDSSWSRLGISSLATALMPVRFPPGRARLADEALLDRVIAAEKDDRGRRGRAFRGSYRGQTARGDHLDLTSDELGG
jgi:hypothetical protein